MNRYYLVMYHGEHGNFLDRLRDLGLVDITITGWEPGEGDRALLQTIKLQRQAKAHIRKLAADERYQGAEPFESGHKAFENYLSATSNIAAVDTRIAQAVSELDELKIWGGVNPRYIDELNRTGIEIGFFNAYTVEFNHRRREWSADCYLQLIKQTDDGLSYFVAIADRDMEVVIDAHQMQPPSMTIDQKVNEIEDLRHEKDKWEDVMARVVASADLIDDALTATSEHLQKNQVVNMSKSGAEGTLMILEGWATKESSVEVDRMLEEYPNLIYLKSTPTPDDDTPVVLKNNRYASAFEFIGNFYSLPRYGTTDLTPFFAPFYMIFFGFCLADAGYGLIVLLAGILLLKKGGEKLRLVSELSVWCGISTIVFGLLQGSLFGIVLGEVEWFSRFRGIVLLNGKNLFTLAMSLGVIQILFAMCIKIYSTIRAFGVKYIFPTLGWMLVLIALLTGFGLPLIGLEVKWFEAGSAPFFATIAVGLFMMLFLNSPGKNPLVNLGSGLWGTYNQFTGTLGDVLSYIRLFAIALSGGILAQVFNKLAMGLSPDIPVLKQLVALIILLVGHGLNLFMSILSSFVHPMRLTFVEFYKNAGFQAGQRVFSPLKRVKKQ